MTAVLSREKSGVMAGDASQTEMILAQIESLPTLPSVAMRLLELTSDQSSSAREVVRLVESDQSMAARILSLVRRAHIGANVSTVERAVVLLGFDAVRCLVLSMQVFEAFSQRVGSADGKLDIKGLWKHSLAVGCAARLLAQEKAGESGEARKQAQGDAAPRANLEEAFLCGLLHDIGKVALHVCFPKSYERVVRAVEGSRGSIAEEEQRVFGLDHTVAGRRLALHWKLPPMIGESIWLHHQSPASMPTRIAFPNHVRLVQVADRLARRMHIGYSGNYAIESTEEAAQAAGVNSAALERVVAALPEQIEERAELIGLERLTSREVYQSALVQANAELARINTRLAIQQRELEERSRCLNAVSILSEASGDQATHEDILKAAAKALHEVHADIPACIVLTSRGRGLSFLAAKRSGADSDVELETWAGAGPSPEGHSGTGWVDARVLPKDLLDRIRIVLGETPAWCWAIRHHREWLGAFVVGGSGEMEPEARPEIDLLAKMVARLTAAAEASGQARQLHEELAGINARLVSAQAEVSRMRSLSLVGEMAAGAAHELNNPLAVISGRAQLLNREGVSDDVRKNAGLISEHAQRASRLVSELMEFAKPAAPAPDAFELPRLLAGIRETWLACGPLNAEQFQIHVSDDMPQVWADESQISILFDELIRNAMEALAGRTETLLVVNCQEHPTDDTVVIRVSDTGRGMTPEVLDRAATPFYSSRPAGRGRGLGLSRAFRFAEINGGRIRLTSEPGVGTQAIVELPRARS